MAGEVINSTEILKGIYPIILDKLGPIVTIFKAVSVVFIVYIIYLMIKGILNWRDRNRIKKIEKKVNEIGEKLDKLLKSSSGDGRKKKKK